MEREKYKFSRFSEEHQTYLISIRQQKVIPTHGSKFHYRKKKHHKNKLESWWYLLPGAYFIFEYSQPDKGYTLHKAIIIKGEDSLFEKHSPANYIPDWLQQLLKTLPKYVKETSSAKHSL